MKRPLSLSRERLEKLTIKELLNLKNKWSIFLKLKDETEFGDSKFLVKEAKNQISIIRDIINEKEGNNGLEENRK